MQLCFKMVRFARIAGFDGTVCSQAIIVRYNVLKSTRGLKKGDGNGRKCSYMIRLSIYSLLSYL